MTPPRYIYNQEGENHVLPPVESAQESLSFDASEPPIFNPPVG